MEKFQTLNSTAIPLPLNDVDTDMLIPAQYLTRTSQDGFGKFLFQRLRESDIDFVLNQSKYSDAKILVAKENFGCGSSREHAVWAVLDWGIKVIIASSFADIFFSNASKNGLVLIKLENQKIEEILQNSKLQTYKITVDLASQRLILPDKKEYEFEFDSFRKECILNGFTDLDYILANQKEIDKFEQKRLQKSFLKKID
jgi:3-isopropylmalate/(R)-2-methylmalate dehydratase small subunit